MWHPLKLKCIKMLGEPGIEKSSKYNTVIGNAISKPSTFLMPDFQCVYAGAFYPKPENLFGVRS